MSAQDCIKFKKGLTDPDDRTLFDAEYKTQIDSGVPPPDAYKYAAEMAMERMLDERNAIASEIREKGGHVADLTIEELLTPAPLKVSEDTEGYRADEGKGGVVYHVTPASKVSKIRSQGLKPLQTSNWVNRDGVRQNVDGGVFSFAHPRDAIRWAFKHEFDHKEPVSIVVAQRDSKWLPDDQMEIFKDGQGGQALKRTGSVPAADILGVYDWQPPGNLVAMGSNINEWLLEQTAVLEKFGQINEKKGVYSDNEISNQPGTTVDTIAEDEGSQGDLFAASDLPVKEARSQAADTFNTQYTHVETSTINSGFDHVTTAGHAAHLVASLRKHAQEAFLVVVTDANDKVISVIRHSKGTRDGASVYPLDIVGAIAGVEGSANAWFAHNHPSGSVQPSTQDMRITKRIVDAASGLGVDFRGHVVIADQLYSVLDQGGIVTALSQKIPAASRNKKIPVTERILKKRTKRPEPLTNPPETIEYIKTLASDTGIILMDNRNAPLGVIALTGAEMAKLRDGRQVRRILSSIDSTNATAAIVFDRDGSGGNTRKNMGNLGNFLGRITGLRVLDNIYIGRDGDLLSASERGETFGRTGGGPFHSRTGKTPEPPFYSELTRQVKALSQQKASAQEWINIIQNLGAKGVRQEEIEFSGIIEELKRYRDRSPENEFLPATGPIAKELIVALIEASEIQIETIPLVERPQAEASVLIQDRAQELLDERIDEMIDDMEMEGTLGDIGLAYDDAGNENPAWFDAVEELRIDIGNGLTWDDFVGEALLEQNAQDLLVQHQTTELITPGGYDQYFEFVLLHKNAKYDYPGNPSHYLHKNQIGWGRATTRTIEGRKELVIEEIQSEIHQLGFKHGYRGGEVSEEVEKARDKVNKWRDKVKVLDRELMLVLMDRGGLSEIQAKSAITVYDLHSTHPAITELAGMDKSLATNYLNATRALEKAKVYLAEKSRPEAVPDAPFKRYWPLVIMKRLIRFAAESGFDTVSWTTGQIQNERYYLSSFIESINYSSRMDPETGETQYSTVVWDDPMNDHGKSGMNYDALVGYVGQDIAERIRAGEGMINKYPQAVLDAAIEGGMTEKQARADIELLMNDPRSTGTDDPAHHAWNRLNAAIPFDPDAVGWAPETGFKIDLNDVFNDIDYTAGKLTGIALTIGDKGMTSFYDQRLLTQVNRFVKKYGTQAKKESLATGPERRVYRYEMEFDAINNVDRHLVVNRHGEEEFAYPTEEGAENKIEELNNLPLISYTILPPTTGRRWWWVQDNNTLEYLQTRYISQLAARRVIDDAISDQIRIDARYQIVNRGAGWRVIDAQSEDAEYVSHPFTERTDAVVRAVALNEQLAISEQMPVWRFPITERLREAALKGFPMFARGEGKKPSMKDVTGWLSPVMSKLAKWVDIEIVQSVADMPGKHPDDVAGMYHQDKIWIVVDNIGDRTHALVTLAHEVVGHLGIETMLGKAGFDGLVREVQSLKRTGNKAILKIIAKLERVYTNDAGEYTLQPDQEAREVLAHLSGNKPRIGKLRELWNRILNRIKLWLSRLGFTDFDAANIESIIIRAARHVQTEYSASSLVGGELVPAYTAAGSPGDRIDMSKVGRVYRAKLLGFDTGKTYYIGSGVDRGSVITTASMDSQLKKNPSMEGVYLAETPGAASIYAAGPAPNITPVYSKHNSPLDLTELGMHKDPVEFYNFLRSKGVKTKKVGRLFESEFGKNYVPRIYEFLDEGGVVLRNQIIKAGYDSVVFDEPASGKTTLVFNPNDIRSVHAAFNPRQAGTGNILHARKKNRAAGILQAESAPRETPLTTKLIKEAREYEGRLWGGAYGAGYLKISARDAPKRKMIAAARKRYSELRVLAGLPKVTDWNNRPETLIQFLSPSESGAEYSRSPDKPAAPTGRSAWQQVSTKPELFKYPTSDSKDLGEVMRETSAGSLSVHKATDTTREWYLGHQTADEAPIDTVWSGTLDIYNTEGVHQGDRSFDVIGSGDVVWVNLATVEVGGGGSMIYNAVANYAYNTGKLFIGDPGGLTDIAFHRRLEAMISTALKFGTTRHIEPHPLQRGDFTGYSQMQKARYLTVGFLTEWQTGAHDRNLEIMLELSYKNAYAFIRGDSDQSIPALSDYRFDPETNEFRSRTDGIPLTEARLYELAGTPGSRAIGAGSTTIKRALLNEFFWQDPQVGAGKIDEWLARYAVEPVPKQLASAQYARSATGANQRTGTLSTLKKEYPEIYAAAQAAIRSLRKDQATMVRDNLAAHVGTPWAAAAVKSLVIRHIFDQMMLGNDVGSLAGSPFWGNDPISGFGQMLNAVSRGESGVERFAQIYKFIGNNRKAENDVSGSYRNCNPSPACARHCYATRANARHVELMKAEFTEMVAEKYPAVLAKTIARQYKSTAAGMTGLDLRFNDKGDLSKAQVGVIKHLNAMGIWLQVFSKRPELLRQLSDKNLRMLSVDATNIEMARENPDLYLAVTLTDGFTEAMVAELNDRVAVYLPVNLRGQMWNTALLKKKYPARFNEMKERVCPVESGKLGTKPGTSFVDIKAGVAKGAWTCTACDLLGAHGCYSKSLKTKNRAEAKHLFDLTAEEAQNSAELAYNAYEKEIQKLLSSGVIDEKFATASLAELRKGLSLLRLESETDATQPADPADDQGGPSYSRGAGRDRGNAEGSPLGGPEELIPRKNRRGVDTRKPSGTAMSAVATQADLMTGQAPVSDYDRMANEHKLIDPYDEVPVPASTAQMGKALSKTQASKIGQPARDLIEGTRVELQIEPRAHAKGVWVVTVHDQGAVVSYGSTAIVKNATFGVTGATDAPRGGVPAIKGEWVATTDKYAQRRAQDVLSSDSWTQVGFDPKRHSYFYDRYSMDPVVSADEVIQVGPLVLAKNPVYAAKTEGVYSRKGRRPRRRDDSASYRIGAAIREVGESGSKFAKREIWGLLNLRQIAEQTRHLIPSIYENYLPEVQRMETVKNRYKRRAGKIAQQRRKTLNTTENDQLSVMQHEATIAGVDPDVAYVAVIGEDEGNSRIRVLNQQIFGRPGSDKAPLMEEVRKIKTQIAHEKNRLAAREGIEELWGNLSNKQRAIYRLERDFHSDLRADQEQALLDRISLAMVDESVKSGIMDKLRREFESSRVQAPYFPLARFGDFWVHSEQDGEPYFDMFETEGEWERHQEEVLSDGGKILAANVHLAEIHENQTVSPEFVGRVNEYIRELGNHPTVDRLRDRIYQLYLESLPELSARKHSIHRSKMRGFYRDHLRAFAHSAQHGANMLGRLAYVHRLQAILDDAELSQKMAGDPRVYGGYQEELEAYESFLTNNISNLSLAQIKREVNNRRDSGPDGYNLWMQYLRIKKETTPVEDDSDPGSGMVIDAVQNRIERRRELLATADRIKAENALVVVRDILTELRKTHAAIVNPGVHPLAAFMNSIGFTWFLGFSVAAGLVNTTQTPVVALPLIAAKFGWKESSKQMGIATKDFFNNKIVHTDGQVYFSVEKSLKNPGEIAAFKRWRDEGLLDKTLTHDLQGISDEGINTGEYRHMFMNVMGFFFHHAERANREITALTAYRAAKTAGQSNAQAAITAEQLTWDAHFNYDQYNRARFMRGNWMRVVTQFKQYSQNITYLYVDTFRRAFKNIPGKARMEARKALTGLLFMQFLAAGALGLPLVLSFIWMAEALLDWDDDDPKDFKAEFRQWLKDQFGPQWGRFFAKGAVDAFTPAAMHGRLTLSDLWLRTSDRELRGPAGFVDIVKAGGGPWVSIMEGFYRGSEQMGKGNIYRGIEQMTPKWVRDPMKASRYLYEDAKTLSGIQIKDMRGGEVFVQALGFASSDLGDVYDQTTTIRNLELRRRERRSELVDKYVQATEMGNVVGIIELEIQIGAWNRKNPNNGIDPQDVSRSAKGRNAMKRQMNLGIRRTQANTDLIDRFNYSGQ